MLYTLKTMPNLTTLDMQLPHIKEFSIHGMSIYLLLNLGVGDRGAQFVVQNLKNLTKLYIWKQWNTSNQNSIGDYGATAIAKDLKILTLLWIRKQCSDADGNTLSKCC
jgi:hypothetical protein